MRFSFAAREEAEEEGVLGSAAYAALEFRAALSSEDARLFCAAAHELAFLFRHAFRCASKAAVCLAAEDAVAAAACGGRCAAVAAAGLALERASTVALPRQAASRVAAARKQALLACKRERAESSEGASSLPFDCLELVFASLDATSLAMVCCVSRAWRDVGAREPLWEAHWRRLRLHNSVLASDTEPPSGGCRAAFACWARTAPRALASALRPRALCRGCGCLQWRWHAGQLSACERVPHRCARARRLSRGTHTAEALSGAVLGRCDLVRGVTPAGAALHTLKRAGLGLARVPRAALQEMEAGLPASDESEEEEAYETQTVGRLTRRLWAL